MVAVYSVTVIVPVIDGWMLQKKLNVPASVKVMSNVSPLFILPESHNPSIAVVVCAIPASLLVNVTVSPTDTVVV